MTAPAPTIDDVIYAIRAYAHSQGWTSYRIAKLARIQPTTLRDFHRLRWAPNAATLRILRSLVPDNFDPAKAKPPPVIEDDEESENGERRRASDVIKTFSEDTEYGPRQEAGRRT